jgi:hypothetical protein
MKRFLIAAVTCVALTVGVAPAMAGGIGGVPQTLPGTTQQNTNTAGDASASNGNATWQSNDQSQTGYGGDASTGDATTDGASCCGSKGDATSGDAYGGDVTQSQDATSSNSTTQDASAESKAEQTLPVNVAVPVCVAYRCDTGGVEQSNANSSGDAWAGNENHTGQSNEQSQAGAGGDASTGDATTGGSGDATTGDAYGGDVTQSQTASNSNDTSQDASADSTAEQTLPVNVAVPVCVAKQCDTGEVRQSNSNSSGDASAWNENGTRQSNEQSQTGYGGDASTGDATTGKGGCCASAGDATSGDAYGGDVTQSQTASNSNSTTQDASAESRAKQTLPVNAYVPVCIAKDCRTGDVRQSNDNRSGDASASNENGTWQSNRQSQKGVGGDATTGDATAGGSTCKPDWHGKSKTPSKPQCGSSGDATSGDAYGGDVTQSQTASNSNSTTQDASAESRAKQTLPVNAYVPVCVAFHCDTGDVHQSNGSRSGDAWAGNRNHTGQSNEQSQTGVGGDAATGDATAKGGCCTPRTHPKPKPECKPHEAKDKGHPMSVEPHGGGNAVSGEAKGGDVAQGQQATNDNGTTQTAYARSKAEQKAPLDLFGAPFGLEPAPAVCRSC